ncbi:MAG: spinster family MFS transporter [Terriglobales bacterium]
MSERDSMLNQRFTWNQWSILLVLMLVNFVNYIDRNIVFPLFPLIRSDFGLTYLQLGVLGTAFSLVHGLGTLPLGMLADRISRKKIISYALFFWSGATFLSGLASSFRMLVTTRALVGIGEAAYAPAATATLTATFPKHVRARVQGAFDMAMFVGGAMGLALGGIIAGSVGWRPAFFIVGIPGLLLGLTVFRLRESQRVAVEKPVPIGQLLKIAPYVMILIGGWFTTFAGYAYITWGTEFVHRYKGFSLRDAGLSFGVVTVLGGAAGVLCGAALADRWRRSVPWGRIVTVPIGFLISVPFIFGALHTSNHLLVLPLFFAGTFFMTWYHGPVTATVHDLTPPQAHATAMGFYSFIVNVSAISLAPIVVGGVADRYGLMIGIHTAIAAQIIGAFCFLIVVAMMRKRAPAREIAPEPLREMVTAD